MNKRLFLVTIFSFISYISFSQEYIIEGKFQNQSAQGMAIYKNTAFLLNNTGICRTYNLKTKKLISSFHLGSYDKNNHANCASFGCERMEGNKCPVMYVSECNKPFRCFVENVTDTKSTLVQTINLHRTGDRAVAHDWIVDRKKRFIYTVARLKWNSQTDKCIHQITKYRLPKLKEGKDVYLTDADVLETYDVEFPYLLQGATIKGGYLFLPTGLHNGNEKRKDAKRILVVVNLKSGRIECETDMTDITINEPEDCDFYKGKLLLYCGQQGGLYEIPIK